MQHLKGFGLENFRVFKDYTWFDFAPITLFIGPNSSGKSSLTKALLLLKSNFLKYENARELDFNLDEVSLQLGNFERVKNKDSNSNSITFSLPFELKNFPTLGQSKMAHFKYEYSQLENSIECKLKRQYIEIDGELFCEFFNTEKKFTINTNLIQKHLFIDETDLKVIKDSDGWKVINEKIFEIDILNNTIDKFPKTLINKKTKIEIEEILDLYRIKKDGEIIEIEIEIDYIEKQYIPETEEYIEFPNTYYEDKPIETALKQAKYSDIQIEYIQNYFLTFKPIHYLSNIEGKFNFKSQLKRIYRREENDLFNELLSLYSAKKSDFINKWGKKFNLSDEFEYHFDSKYNFQTVNFGLPLVEQGLGISNIMTILLRLAIFSEPNRTIIFEEPEANLHPAFQSKLADLLIDAQKQFTLNSPDAITPCQQFIIETHSEYMVRKFQYLVAKGEMKKEDIVIYYFNDPNNIPVDEPQVKKITIDEYGGLSSDFGSGFFDEAANWELELLRLKKNKIRQN